MDNNSNSNQKPLTAPPRQQSSNLSERQRQALLNLQREKLEQIYSGRSRFSTPQTTPVSRTETVVSSAKSNLAEQFRNNTPTAPAQVQNNQTQNQQNTYIKQNSQTPRNSHQPQQFQAHGEAWKKYHAAWQNYYQKYYEKYYSAALEYHKKSTPAIQPEVAEELTEEQKKQRALAQLKKDIADRARKQTERVRKSRHFVPITTAFVVVATFLFLQYNRLIFASVEAYIKPNNPSERQTIQTPNAKIEVSADPKIIIPKINVDAPVAYGIGNDAKSQLDAMNNGLAHFAIPGANSVPGQIGNTVISGHSSNDLFDGGDYKFIFAQLEKLKEGDIIYANYQGKQYSYAVREFKVVMPNEVSSVIRNDGKPWLTLITCTPLGTAQKRLLVFAEQISPDPAAAAPAEQSSANLSEPAEIPRNSKTFFERLFSWDWS
ncbi:MAG: sortase [bacterium]|nr:sortase [bacterium]